MYELSLRELQGEENDMYVCMYVCMYACMHACMYLSVCLSVRPSVRPSVRLSLCLSVSLSLCLSVSLSLCLSVSLERCAVEKSAEDNRVHLHMPAWAVVARSCQPLAKGLPDTAVLSNNLCETATGIDVNV